LKFLLDTCTFLWLNTHLSLVPAHVQKACADKNNELYLSVVSAWEIALKESEGGLSLPLPAARYIPSRRAMNGIASLDLTEETVLQLPKLPALHKDPFDRMLICQAIEHGMAILTPDSKISQYPIRVMW
jgi:PIN domain nuclease of toxin-antitoxin system